MKTKLLLFTLLSIISFSCVQEILSATKQTQEQKATYDDTCPFCRIIAKKDPANILAENADVIVFQSRSGHPLIVPKKHIKDARLFDDGDKDIWFKVLQTAQVLSKQQQGSSDFQFHINTGPNAGQTVFHVHIHYIPSGKLNNNVKI